MSSDPARSGEQPGPALLDELLCFDLYAASRAVTAAYRPLLEPLGLTYPQYLVMVLLWQRQTASVRDVIDSLQLEYGTVSPLLKRLQARGLLTRARNVSDERSVMVSLTDAGRDLAHDAAHVPTAVRVAMGLTEAEVPTVREFLTTISTSASRTADGQKTE